MSKDSKTTRETQPQIAVLKFGSSVLRSPADLPGVISEIYRHVRLGEHVVAVVSAFSGVTDRIFAEVRRWTPEPNQHALATAVAIGEMDSATHLVFALERSGIPVAFLDPRDVQLRTQGDRLNAEPVAIDAIRLRQIVEQWPVTVIPGFYGLAQDQGIALLGRGGSDLTAVYLAQRLNASCVLVKDVDGLYEFDPLPAVTRPRRFKTASYDDVLRVGAELIQAKAVECARSTGQHVEIRAIGQEESTAIGPSASTLVCSRILKPLRVALFGLGTVGRGVYEYIAAQGNLYELVAILVRDPAKHIDAGVPSRLLMTDAAKLLGQARSKKVDAVIEAIGDLEAAQRLTLAAVAGGCTVVTANKELIATHWDSLSQYLLGATCRLRCSAAVGGAVPMMELVRRLAAHPGIKEIRGVVNGTCNFILDRLAAGVSFDAAVREAQEKGYAEPDPSADLDGLDAARKIEILCRLAFKAPPSKRDILGLRDLGTALSDQSPKSTCRLIASVGVDRIARVAPVALPDTEYLAQARGAENRLEVTTTDGAIHRVSGLGAGRYPAATSILADLLDVVLARPHAT